MPRRKLKWWVYLLPPATARFLRSPDGQLLLSLLTDWWIRREELFGAGPRSKDERRLSPRYGRVACYQMLQTHRYPPLSDWDELALDAVHGAFERWAQTRKARTLARRSYEQVRHEIARFEQLASERPDLDLGELFGSDTRHDIAHQVGHGLQQAVHDGVHHDVQHSVHHDVQHSVHSAVHASVHSAVHASVHSAVHASVHSAIHDAASHAGGGHADGGGGGHH
jgi:ribosomal protein L9